MDSGPGRTFTFPFQLSFTMKCRWITLELVSYLDALKNVAVLTVYYMCTQVNTHTHMHTQDLSIRKQSFETKGCAQRSVQHLLFDVFSVYLQTL